MMKKIAFGIAGMAIAASATFADSHVDPAVATGIKARKAHMDLYAHNLGVLGGMAQNKIDYDASAAQAAADNLLALALMSQAGYWPQGSDTDSAENTRALPALWQDFGKASEIAGTLTEAAQAMSAAAGGGVDGIKEAMGPLGGACGACHKAFRQPKN